MGEINRAGREAKKVLESFLREFPNSITATWTTKTGGSYDEFSQDYVGATESVQTLSFAAIIESDKIQFKYEKYGVDESTDIMAIVSVNVELPPQEAYYTRTGDIRKYSLKAIYPEGNYGTDSTGNQLYAYRILHLRSA